jgi:hypothetical protein
MPKPLLALAPLMLLAAAARADEPNVIAPYRYAPPPETLSPLEDEKASAYRMILQNQLRNLDQAEAFGKLEHRDRRQLLDTRRELGRIDLLLNR